jgi:hypothetical protein
MDKTTIFLLLTVWYFGRYPQEIYHLLFKGYQIFMCIANFYIDYYTEDEILKNELQEINNNKKNNNNIENNNNNIENNNNNNIEKETEKYEDKYLSEIRKMDKEFKFDEEEQKLRDVKFESFVSQFFSVYEDKIKNYKNELNNIEIKYNRYNVSDEEFNNIIEEEKYRSDYDEEYYDTYIKDNSSESKEQILQSLTLQKAETVKEISKIQEYIDSNEGKEKIITQSKEESLNFIINNRLKKIKIVINYYLFIYFL